MNNYEKIKQMTVEEMAEWLENYSTNIIVTKCIRNYHRHKEAFSEAHREYADDFKHQVRTLFEEG